ncbi:MAG: DUF2288 domain-containing protein [Cyanobacteria bacterium J06649_4]
MAGDLLTELTEMMGPVQWEWLKPHVQRDAVVVVNEALNLAEVGVAIASNNTQTVERWITEQLILKPNAEQLAVWSAEDKRFMSLIVQPYVLVQEPSATSDSPSDAPV